MLHHAGTLNDHFAPKRGRRHRRTRELAIYLLTPGFSTAYHSHTLGVSANTIRKHLSWSRTSALKDPAIADDVERNLASITAEDGLRIAQIRGTTHLPWWSRLAIAEFSARLQCTSEVAALFRCSRRTVQQALTRGCHSYDMLTSARRLSSSQASPSRKWTPNR